MTTRENAPYCIVNTIRLLKNMSVFSDCVRKCVLIYEDLQQNFLSLEDRPVFLKNDVDLWTRTTDVLMRCFCVNSGPPWLFQPHGGWQQEGDCTDSVNL